MFKYNNWEYLKKQGLMQGYKKWKEPNKIVTSKLINLQDTIII